MNKIDRNPPQITPNNSEIAQTFFSEISQLINSAKQRAAIHFANIRSIVSTLRHRPFSIISDQIYHGKLVS